VRGQMVFAVLVRSFVFVDFAITKPCKTN